MTSKARYQGISKSDETCPNCNGSVLYLMSLGRGLFWECSTCGQHVDASPTVLEGARARGDIPA